MEGNIDRCLQIETCFVFGAIRICFLAGAFTIIIAIHVAGLLATSFGIFVFLVMRE
jgi:hypothetical protein